MAFRPKTGAGRMDREITIVQPVFTQNTFGEPIPAWETFATVWAHFRPETVGGGEQYEERQFKASIIAVYTIRYIEGLTENMRIRDNGVEYNIVQIPPIPRENQLMIRAVTVDDSA